MNAILFIRKLFTEILDFLFPSRCTVCGDSIPFTENCLCGSCISRIDFIENGCKICSGPLMNAECAICSRRAWYIKRNIALAEYSDVMREILHSFKFNGRRRLNRHLSSLSYNRLVSLNLDFDFITSVPMSRSKKWKRGYNQTELIAKQLSKKSGKTYLPLLAERRGSKTQRELNYRERFINILDRYMIKDSNNLKGGKILIIDDVFTTGATINECARVLKSSGAADVYSFTIARADIRI